MTCQETGVWLTMVEGSLRGAGVARVADGPSGIAYIVMGIRGSQQERAVLAGALRTAVLERPVHFTDEGRPVPTGGAGCPRGLGAAVVASAPGP